MNVVWFVLDTLRSDHLGCYGYFRDTSPQIDRLAAEGVLFEQSYASSIATGPGFTGLFTGLAAINHGFYFTPWNVTNVPLLDDAIVTLPEIVQARGDYTTAAFDNLMNFRSHMKQFVRGFEYYVNVTRSPAWQHHWIIADEVNRRLLPWLDEHADETFFLFVHYWDPHTPYNMPERFRGRFDMRRGDLATRRAPDGYEYVPGWGQVDSLPGDDVIDDAHIHVGGDALTIDLYDDEVFYVDHAVGQVVARLEKLGLLDETTVIVTADHGEDLGLHGHWGHMSVHETTIRVPLIIRDPRPGPDSPDRGQRVTGFAQHADNLPTILEYFPQQQRPSFDRVSSTDHMPAIPDTFDGQSLLPLAQRGDTGRQEIVVESAQARAYIAPPWKLIWHKGGRSELYHVVNDPLELNDRSLEEPRRLRDLTERLQAWTDEQLGEGESDPILFPEGISP